MTTGYRIFGVVVIVTAAYFLREVEVHYPALAIVGTIFMSLYILRSLLIHIPLALIASWFLKKTLPRDDNRKRWFRNEQ